MVELGRMSVPGLRSVGRTLHHLWDQCRFLAVKLRPLGWLFLLVSVGVAAQVLVEPIVQTGTGLRLRMSDSLDSQLETERDGLSPETESDLTGGRLRGLSLRMTMTSGFDDNVSRSSSNKQSDLFVNLRPAAYLDGSIRSHDFRLGYEGDFVRYRDLTDDSFFDHRLFANANVDIHRKVKLRLRSGLTFGHESRGGVVSRLNQSRDPDNFREHNLGGDLVVGRRIAKAQVGVSYDYTGLRHTSNNQENRDFDTQEVRVFGRYNLGPKLGLIAEAGVQNIDYLDPHTPLDSRIFDVLGGVTWEATAKTSGEVKVGLLRENRDSSAEGTRGANWSGKVNWSPRPHSHVTAFTGREVQQSGQAANGSALTDTYGLRWRHGLTERLTFESGLDLGKTEFDNGRTDELFRFDAGVNYELNHWLDIGAGWGYSTRSSTVSGANWDDNIVFIRLDAHLDKNVSKKRTVKVPEEQDTVVPVFGR